MIQDEAIIETIRQAAGNSSLTVRVGRLRQRDTARPIICAFVDSPGTLTSLDGVSSTSQPQITIEVIDTTRNGAASLAATIITGLDAILSQTVTGGTVACVELIAEGAHEYFPSPSGDDRGDFVVPVKTLWVHEASS